MYSSPAGQIETLPETGLGQNETKSNISILKDEISMIRTTHQHERKIVSTVLEDKPTKCFGHFEEIKFFVGSHQFLLVCCPKITINYNFGQKRQG
jgi:hypothetical protein